jgi:hypothetical protein
MVDPIGIGTFANIVGGLFNNRDKQRIPAPKTAEQIKSDMDTVYTGTTPWERLGSQGGGIPALAGTQDQAKIMAAVQQQNHRNQMKIARLNATKDIQVANIQAKGQNPFSEGGREGVWSDVKDIGLKTFQNLPDAVKNTLEKIKEFGTGVSDDYNKMLFPDKVSKEIINEYGLNGVENPHEAIKQLQDIGVEIERPSKLYDAIVDNHKYDPKKKRKFSIEVRGGY